MDPSYDILHHLAIVAPIIPFPIYWTNTEPRVIGANQACIKAMGAAHFDEVVGKTPHEYYPKELADSIVAHGKLVIQANKTLVQEDIIRDISTGEARYYAAIRSPLVGADGKVIGVIGTSIEITAQKQAEQLKLENERQQATLQEQEKFRKIVDQAAHDIRSPLASLLMITKMNTDLPEQDRVDLREIATSISDIATNLLSHYTCEQANANLAEEHEPLLISAVLLDLLAEKRYQYQGASVSFKMDFQPGCHFTFANLAKSAFKRMLSNLINNAVDAVDGHPGKVVLGLDADDALVKIYIRDNGKGMSEALIDKIVNNLAVTEGKEDGHGIGLIQVREALQRNQGTFSIDSATGKGTTIHLTFPRTAAPTWITQNLTVNSQDTVVILDDEPTIHGAWDAYFAKKAPKISPIHFDQVDKALTFLHEFKEKDHILLLTDYELLKQPYNGLDVIAQTQVKHAVLVTSHYANKLIQEQAVKLGATVLPKQLAPEIPILLE